MTASTPARRAGDPEEATFIEQRKHNSADEAVQMAMARCKGVFMDAAAPTLQEVRANRWPDPAKMTFNLDSSSTDPHNPANRSRPLNRRRSDR